MGQKGRVLDSNGKVKSTFFFADPSHDVDGLNSDTKLRFVKESDVIMMLDLAGAFSLSNNTQSVKIRDRYKYISKEGVPYAKLDFASKPRDGIGTVYGEGTYNSLYLIDGVAHNAYNFGNFLYGAAGISLGYISIELLAGAHYNSLFPTVDNGYKPQFDSKDDQLSIFLGILHAYINRYPYNVK